MMKVALIIGASRGMGRQVALTLADQGYAVGVAAKTVTHTEKLPGTIYDVCKDIESSGGNAIPIQCNVRDVSQIDSAVDVMLKTYGKLDFVMYNAGAILWEPVINTPMKRLELMWEVNMRGAYGLVQKVLPYFLKQKKGNILMVSPPIYSRFFKGKAPYATTKVGLTVLVSGMEHELAGTGVNISTIWPATATESFVTVKQNVPKVLMRKPTLFADACYNIAEEKSDKYNGKALIDEDLLRDCRVNDFTKYRCDPSTEPPRMMPKKFPSLLVEEQNEETVPISKI